MRPSEGQLPMIVDIMGEMGYEYFAADDERNTLASYNGGLCYFAKPSEERHSLINVRRVPDVDWNFVVDASKELGLRPHTESTPEHGLAYLHSLVVTDKPAINTGKPCPSCGRSLWEDGKLLMSYPPKVAFKCFGCGEHGYRVVAWMG